jgi:hypothetical protein
MRGKLNFRPTLWAMVALLIAATSASAQNNSNVAAVNLNAVVNPQLAVAVSPATVNFAMVPGSSDRGDSVITIQTAWNLPFGYSFFIAQVSLWAYFTTPGAALTDGAGNNIPAANVRGSVNGGAYTPFTTAGPFSAAGLRIFSQNVITIGALRRGTRTDTLDLEIDTAGLGLPAGVYTGVLNIRAQAI